MSNIPNATKRTILKVLESAEGQRVMSENGTATRALFDAIPADQRPSYPTSLNAHLIELEQGGFVERVTNGKRTFLIALKPDRPELQLTDIEKLRDRLLAGETLSTRKLEAEGFAGTSRLSEAARSLKSQGHEVAIEPEAGTRGLTYTLAQRITPGTRRAKSGSFGLIREHLLAGKPLGNASAMQTFGVSTGAFGKVKATLEAEGYAFTKERPATPGPDKFVFVLKGPAHLPATRAPGNPNGRNQYSAAANGDGHGEGLLNFAVPGLGQGLSVRGLFLDDEGTVKIMLKNGEASWVATVEAATTS